MTGGVNGVNQVNPAEQMQVQAEQAGAAGAQRPIMNAGLRLFLKIVTVGISELFIRHRENHRIAAAQPPARPVAPNVPDIGEVDVNRANAQFKADLDKGKLPDIFLPAKQEAFDSFKTRFGQANISSVSLSEYAVKLTAVAGILKEIEKGDRVITPEIVKGIFEKTYALEFLDNVAGEEGHRLATEKGVADNLPGMNAVRMASPLLRTSTEVAEKIDAIQNPAQVAELVSFAKERVVREFENRLALAQKFVEVKDKAFKELTTKGGLDERTAKRFLDGVSPESFCDVEQEGLREERTGYIKKDELARMVDGMEAKFREKKIDKLLPVLEEINRLGISAPAKERLRGSALTGSFKKVPVLQMLAELSQKMDVSGIVSALKSRNPKASVIAKALEALLATTYKELRSELDKFHFGVLGADEFTAFYAAIGIFFFNSHPELCKLVGEHMDVFAAGGLRLQANVNFSDAWNSQIYSFATYFMRSPDPAGLSDRLDALEGSRDIAKVLRMGADAIGTDVELEEQMRELVSARHDALRQRLGKKQVEKDLWTSAAWQATKAAIVARVDAGGTVDVEAVADAYEMEVLHEIVHNALYSTAQEAAGRIGLQGKPDLHGLVNRSMFADVTTSRELSQRLESLKALVPQEISAQKMMADESARLQNSVFEQLAQELGIPQKNVAQLVGNRLANELQTQCSELIRSVPRLNNGALVQDAISLMKQEVQRVVADFQKERLADAAKISAMELDPEVRSELLKASLRGDGVVTPERVAKVKALIDDTDATPILNDIAGDLENTKGCFAAIRSAMSKVLNSLNVQIVGLEGDDLQLFTHALLKGLLAKTPGLGELLASNVDAAGRLLVQARQEAFLGDQDAGAAVEKQMVLDLVTMASNNAVLDHARIIEVNRPIMSQLEAGQPGEGLRLALNDQVSHLRQCFGNRWVEENWSITGSVAWSRTHEALRHREATSNDVLTEADVVREYEKQARLVILEARMAHRVQKFLTANNMQTNDSAAVMAENVMSRSDAFELVQRIQRPRDFDRLADDLDEVFRREIGHQYLFHSLREAAHDSIFKQFVEASGLELELVSRDLNIALFDRACDKIFDEVARDEESGNITDASLQRVPEEIENLKASCGGRLQLMKDVVADNELSDHVKAFLKVNVLKVPHFNQPELLVKLKAALREFDVAPLTNLLAAGGDNLGTRFLDELARLMEPVGTNFAAGIGNGADQDILYPLFGCFVTMLLDAHPDLKAAVDGQAQALAPAGSQISERLGNLDANLPAEKARALKLCEAFFQNDQLPQLAQQVQQVR